MVSSHPDQINLTQAMETKLRIYIDQEPDGMWLLRSDSYEPYKLSHTAFIAGDWLSELPLAENDEIQLIVERAHTVSALKSPAQRFTATQWDAFYAKCRAIDQCRVVPLAWPERVTSNARRFAYGNHKKADKNSGVHDIRAIKIFHEARPTLKLMRLGNNKDTIPLAIRTAVAKHRKEMNYDLLRLKNHKYPDNDPMIIQCRRALEELALVMSENQKKILDLKFSKRNPSVLNKRGWNPFKTVTLWALTRNPDGTRRVDDVGRPISHVYLKTIIGNSPYRERRCGVHRANIMKNARSSFIASTLGMSKPKSNDLINPKNIDRFISARNQFDREWLKLAKMFRDYGDLT